MAIPLPTTRNQLPDTIPASAQPPVPIGYTASGSGGINLALTFRLYMIAAGRGRRLQPPLFVNHNEAEQGRIWAYLSFRGRRVSAILPRHLHRNPEGFGGNPTTWKEDEGLIRLDLEGMADRASAHSRRIGSQPGVFVEFLVAGGGHGEIGLILHQALATEQSFPATFYLPICLIPDDVTQLAWLRVYTWHRYESCLAGLWGFLIDNAAKPQAVINDLLAIGLTDLDTCSSSDLTAGSLRQAVASLLNDVTHGYPNARNGFFRIAVIRRVLRSRKAWRLGFPLRQRKLIRSNTNDLEYAIRTAIKDCLETPAGLLDTNPLPTAGIPQVVCVSIPVKQEQLTNIVRSLKAMLEREEWWQNHSATTNLLWGAINYPDPIVIDITKAVPTSGWLTRSYRAALWLVTLLPRLLHLLVFGRNHQQRELYATVTRLFPELGAYSRLHHILHPEGMQTNGTGNQGWGYGSLEHLATAPPQQNSHAETAPAAAAAAPVASGNGRARQRRRGRQTANREEDGSREDETPAKAAGSGRRRVPGFPSGLLPTLLVCGGLALAFITGGAGGMPSQGFTDTRQDVYELTGKTLQDADSAVALFPAASVKDRGDGTSKLLTVPYGHSLNLCPSERFWQQPSGSYCSGVLVAEDVIATAAHCIDGEPISAFFYVFGYRMRNATTPELIIDNRDIYQARAVIAWRLDHKGSDWALIRLDRPVVGHHIAPIPQAGTTRREQPVHAIGYPLGLPVKVAPGHVQSTNDASLVTSIPSYPGNSGSPVFNSATHALEGIIFAGKEPKLVKQGACIVTRARSSLATRVSAFAAALSTLRRNP
jgi:V8-like Glu-specific endopeptidase